MMKDDTFNTPLGKGGHNGTCVSYVSGVQGATFRGAKGRIYKYNPRYGYSVVWDKVPNKNAGPGLWEFFGQEELKVKHQERRC